MKLTSHRISQVFCFWFLFALLGCAPLQSSSKDSSLILEIETELEKVTLPSGKTVSETTDGIYEGLFVSGPIPLLVKNFSKTGVSLDWAQSTFTNEAGEVTKVIHKDLEGFKADMDAIGSGYGALGDSQGSLATELPAGASHFGHLSSSNGNQRGLPSLIRTSYVDAAPDSTTRMKSLYKKPLKLKLAVRRGGKLQYYTFQYRISKVGIVRGGTTEWYLPKASSK